MGGEKKLSNKKLKKILFFKDIRYNCGVIREIGCLLSSVLLMSSIGFADPQGKADFRNRVSLEKGIEADTNFVEIKIGMRPSAVKRIVGEPLIERIVNRFWGVKKALYEISEKEFCIVEYRLGRTAHISFLENVTFFEAKRRFESSIP